MKHTRMVEVEEITYDCDLCGKDIPHHEVSTCQICGRMVCHDHQATIRDYPDVYIACCVICAMVADKYQEKLLANQRFYHRLYLAGEKKIDLDWKNASLTYLGEDIIGR